MPGRAAHIQLAVQFFSPFPHSDQPKTTFPSGWARGIKSPPVVLHAQARFFVQKFQRSTSINFWLRMFHGGWRIASCPMRNKLFSFDRRQAA